MGHTLLYRMARGWCYNSVPHAVTVTVTDVPCCVIVTAAFLLLRGIKTLALRVERQSANAAALAAALEKHPLVSRLQPPAYRRCAAKHIARSGRGMSAAHDRV